MSGDYSIVDIAAYPWIERHGWTGLGLARYPALEAWAGRIAERPAVARGMAQPSGICLEQGSP